MYVGSPVGVKKVVVSRFWAVAHLEDKVRFLS